MKNAIFGFLALTTLSLFPAQQEAMAALPLVNGIVRRVDLANNTAMIRHNYIPNLDMAPMTMNFSAAHPSLLVGLNPGDRIQFTADNVNGTLTLLSVQPY